MGLTVNRNIAKKISRKDWRISIVSLNIIVYSQFEFEWKVKRKQKRLYFSSLSPKIIKNLNKIVKNFLKH